MQNKFGHSTGSTTSATGQKHIRRYTVFFVNSPSLEMVNQANINTLHFNTSLILQCSAANGLFGDVADAVSSSDEHTHRHTRHRSSVTIIMPYL